MLYNSFKDLHISRLGFGAMRLPLNEDKSIDREHTAQMIDYAMEHGVNYFDTAYPYMNCLSEIILSQALAKYPRESYYFATKYPGHQPSDHYDPAEVFEDQLRKCNMDYFDFYLLHNVNAGSVDVYTDPQWGIVDYFVEQRRLGRIKHLGFSCHIDPEGLGKFLDYCGDEMEFCQIQLNYLDWTLQKGKEKYNLLTKRGIPIWVMESVRGGKLAHLYKSAEAKLMALRPEESIPGWSFRFLQDLPNIKVILSGMSALDQMIDNVRTFECMKPLNEEERATLFEIAEELKDSLPCTACRYCCDGCPAGLDIPRLIEIYNDMRVEQSLIIAVRMGALPLDKWPEACIGCGQCAEICPQKIDIPAAMKDLAQQLAKKPTWVEVSQQREREADELKKQRTASAERTKKKCADAVRHRDTCTD